MQGKLIHGVCREPFSNNDAWFVRIHALRFVGGSSCKANDFPDEEGDVFWAIGSELPTWVREGALCTLQVERGKRYGEPGLCWYQAVRGTVQPLSTELIDMSGRFGTEDDWLQSREFYTDWPVSQRIYIRIGTFVYGPFDVGQEKRRVYMVEKHQDYTYYRYRWADVQSSLAHEVRTPQGYVRWIIEDEEGFGGLERSSRDGRTNIQLVNWYLRGLKDSGYVPQETRAQLTRKAVRAAATSYDFFSSEPDLVEHRVFRLQRLGEVFLRMVRQEPTIIETAMGRTAFEAAVQERIKQVVRQHSTAIEEQLKSLRKELAQRKAERDELEAELSTLQTQLAEEREQFGQEMEKQLQLMTKQKKHLLEERERLLRDFWVLSGLLVQEGTLEPAAVQEPSMSETPEGTFDYLSEPTDSIGNEEYAEEPREFAQQLLQMVDGDPTRLSMFERLHNTVRSHRLFALQDPNDLIWFQRYVAALGPATRMHHVAVEAAWTNLESLFGRVNPYTRWFEPSASGALEFWLNALEAHNSSTGGVWFLILNDANRSPIEVWMSKLLLKAAKPDSFSLALFHPRQVVANDDFVMYADLPWPDNLRVVCVLASDPYSYQPTDSLSRRLSVLSFGSEGTVPPLGTADTFKSVSMRDLLGWDWQSVLEALS
jgi:cell division protein FtsB